MSAFDLVVIDPNATVRRMIRRLFSGTAITVADFHDVQAAHSLTASAGLVFVNVSRRPADVVEFPDELPASLQSAPLVLSSVTPELVQSLFPDAEDRPYVEMIERPFSPHDLIDLCRQYCARVREEGVELPNLVEPDDAPDPPVDIDVMTVDEPLASGVSRPSTVRISPGDVQKLIDSSGPGAKVTVPPRSRLRSDHQDTPKPSSQPRPEPPEPEEEGSPPKRVDTVDFDAELTADSIDVSELLEEEIEELSAEYIYAVDEDDEGEAVAEVEVEAEEDAEVDADEGMVLGTDDIHMLDDDDLEEIVEPASDATPIPDRGPERIAGSVRAWPLPDMLTTAERRGFSGVIELERDGGLLYTVYLVRGRIDWIEPRVDRLRRRLGSFLVDAGMLDPSHVEMVMESPLSEELLIGEQLVVKKLVTADQVFQALLWQASSYLWDLLALHEGTFSLTVHSPDAVARIFPSRPALQLDISLEMMNFFRSFPDYLPLWRSVPGTRLVLNPGMLARFDPLPWLPEELWLQEVLSLEPHSVDGLLERADNEGQDVELVRRSLRRFQEFHLLSQVFWHEET